MKGIIVYYSLEGNTDWVARRLAKRLQYKLLRIEPKKAFPTKGIKKFLWGGSSVVLHQTPELVPYEFKKEEYDRIIIGGPIWAGSYASPLTTFFQENDISKKQIALFACHSGSPAEKCFKKAKKRIGITDVIAEAEFIDPCTKQPEENKKKLNVFIKKVKDQ